MMKNLILRSLVVVASLLCVSTAAFGQYVWLDEKGVKQFSDQPPPPSVPKNKILKFSGKTIELQESTTDQDNDPPAKAKPTDNIAEKEMAYKKRLAEQAKAQKKAEDETKLAAEKQENCRKMRDYKQSLDSGQRIALVDANGNRSFMADDKRAEEINNLNQGLSACGN